MGQARRRKQQLGDLYGTKEGSNTQPIQLLKMPRALAEAYWNEYARDPDCILLFAEIGEIEHGGESCVIAAWPTLDAAGQFNSYVVCHHYKSALSKTLLRGHRKNADHKAINQFLLENANGLAGLSGTLRPCQVVEAHDE